MDQKEFTNYVVSKLLASFPFFTIEQELTENDICKIEYPSKKGTVKLLISTADREITVGFAAGKGLFDWHVHMDMLGAHTEEQSVAIAIELIQEILNDEKIICFSSSNGFYIPWYEENTEEYKLQGDTVTYWSLL
jgi:hypothetical protein